MSGPQLSVGRGVIAEMARLAAMEVPDVIRVARGGPAWRAALRGSPLAIRIHGDRVDVRIWVVARPASDLRALATGVRGAIGAAIERLLGLHVGSVTVVVDGVGV
jgi:uncharacterized alkaline shock family protein YloU